MVWWALRSYHYPQMHTLCHPAKNAPLGEMAGKWGQEMGSNRPITYYCQLMFLNFLKMGYGAI
jgi:hypothetical protein